MPEKQGVKWMASSWLENVSSQLDLIGASMGIFHSGFMIAGFSR